MADGSFRLNQGVSLTRMGNARSWSTPAESLTFRRRIVPGVWVTVLIVSHYSSDGLDEFDELDVVK